MPDFRPPPLPGDGPAIVTGRSAFALTDSDSARRVEPKIRLADDTTIKQVLELLLHHTMVEVARGLPLRGVPEQHHVASVREHVVDDSGDSYAPFSLTPQAKRMMRLEQLR